MGKKNGFLSAGLPDFFLGYQLLDSGSPVAYQEIFLFLRPGWALDVDSLGKSLHEAVYMKQRSSTWDKDAF